MELYIADTLKKLRAERGNTQEDLANHLNISIQAVSKWERNEGFPDITMLPGIAAYYDVTVDTLLGCDRLKKEEDIRAFEKECHMLLNQGKSEEKLSLCREMQKKYPHEEAVLYHLMSSLANISRKNHANEILLNAEKLLTSPNANYRHGAILNLCFTHKILGNAEQAKKYAEMFPANRDYLQFVLEGEELVLHCQRSIWYLCDQLGVTLKTLLQCKEAGYSADECHEAYQMLYTLYHMIYKNGDFGFWEDRLGRLCFHLAECSASSNELDRALDELEEMFTHLEKAHSYVSMQHTSLLVNRIYHEAEMVGRSSDETVFEEFSKRLTRTVVFDPLREHPRFIELMQKIREKMKIKSCIDKPSPVGEGGSRRLTDEE